MPDKPDCHKLKTEIAVGNTLLVSKMYTEKNVDIRAAVDKKIEEAKTTKCELPPNAGEWSKLLIHHLP